MKINLLAIGQKMPAFITAGIDEYRKRLPKDVVINLIEIPAIFRGKQVNTDQLVVKESELLLKAIPKRNHVVALDRRGKIWSTEQLAKELKTWKELGEDVSILIGGPDGLSEELIQKANQTWSLSNLTFPHPLVRLILSEQLYRATTILNQHPYHR